MKINWSIISIISRFGAVGIGLIQSLIIIKILSVEEYGVVGLVGSIASIVGVYQNLGISSGSTREIAATKDLKEAFKVFIGATVVRYIISFPLVIGLYFSADYLGNVYYHRPEIVYPIKLFAVVLFIQALQSVLTSFIQGLKKFKFLFIFQVLIAVVSICIFVPMMIYYNMLGYFYALLLFNIASTVVLCVYVYLLVKDSIEIPTWTEFVHIFKAVFSIGLFVYFIKIIIIQWQKLGPVVLANDITDEMLGVFTFVLLVASKVSVISDAVTDVTLPSMTEVYKKSKESFKSEFLKGNSKAYFLILFTSVMLVLLKVQLFYIVDFLFSFIGKDPISVKYASGFAIMDPVILGFWAYSHLNLIKSGVAVPAKKLWGAIVSFGIMFISTLLIYRFTTFEPLMRYSIAMGGGALLGYISMLFSIKKELSFFPISKNDIEYSMICIFILVLYYLGSPFYITATVLCILTALYYKFSFMKLDGDKKNI